MPANPLGGVPTAAASANNMGVSSNRVAVNTGSSFVPHRLQVRLTLDQGSFGGGGNSKIIDKLAMRVDVEKLGPPDFGKASVTIFGMSLEEMEQLTTLAMEPFKVKRNYINIYAGDDVTGLSEIFAGSVIDAQGDLSGAPEAQFKINAEVGFWGRVTAQGPSVINGTQDVASFISTQAQNSELTFTNEGVSAQIKDCVFDGTPINQARQAAAMVGADLLIDDSEMILLPRNGNRKGDSVLLSPSSGVMGYPTISGNGIEVKTVFNPALRFAGLFVLETVVPKAAGTWRVTKLTHKLSANDPSDGSWETQVTGYYPELSGAVGKFI